MEKILLINFKTYKQGAGTSGVKLAKLCSKLAKTYNKNIWLAVQAADINKISKIVDNKYVKILAQHVDPIEPNRNTGFISAYDIKKDGAYGTLLNHSEHKIKFQDLKNSIYYCKKNKLTTIVCASDVNEVKKVSKLKPDFIAIEPPELIAGKISVSKAKPSLITNSVRSTKIRILCGAGIKNSEDVKIAVKLGVHGVLVASGIMLNANKQNSIKDLIIYL